MTTNSLWQAIDDHLQAILTTDLSGLSVTVSVSDEFTPEDYDPPSLIIYGNRMDAEGPGAMYDAETHLAFSYPYALAFVVAGDNRTEAKNEAKRVATAIRESLRLRFGLSGLSYDGERVQRTAIGQVAVDVLGGRGGDFLGVGAVEFTVYSEV